MKTVYDLLGVSPDADYETIRAAFRKAAKVYHPDLNAGDPTAEQQFKEINAAHTLLKSPDERAAYDWHVYINRQQVRREWKLAALAAAVCALISIPVIGGSGLDPNLLFDRWFTKSPAWHYEKPSDAKPAGLSVVAAPACAETNTREAKATSDPPPKLVPSATVASNPNPASTPAQAISSADRALPWPPPQVATPASIPPSASPTEVIENRSPIGNNMAAAATDGLTVLAQGTLEQNMLITTNPVGTTLSSEPQELATAQTEAAAVEMTFPPASAVGTTPSDKPRQTEAAALEVTLPPASLVDTTPSDKTRQTEAAVEMTSSPASPVETTHSGKTPQDTAMTAATVRGRLAAAASTSDPIETASGPIAAGLPACISTRPSNRQLGRNQISGLLERGREFMANGNVAAARLVFQRAAEACDTEATLAIGATYDPIRLKELGLRALAPDINSARAWYEKAKTLGSDSASRQLELLANADR
jgi:DnaJ domain